MTAIIVADSCSELNEDLEKRIDLRRVAFPITLEGHSFLDDGSMDIPSFIQEIARASEIPKTGGPSPQSFIDAIGDAKEGFIVTISSKLSGTYSNACMAVRQLEEEEGNRRFHVFDSQSASVGESRICWKLGGWLEEGLSFEEIVQKGEAYISQGSTYFVLDDLSSMIKSGRIPKYAGKVASKLSIHPICKGVEGEVKVAKIKRGMNSALQALAELVREEIAQKEEKRLWICHINRPDRADYFCSLVGQDTGAEIHVVEGTGLSTVYANDGGIIIAF